MTGTSTIQRSLLTLVLGCSFDGSGLGEGGEAITSVATTSSPGTGDSDESSDGATTQQGPTTGPGSSDTNVTGVTGMTSMTGMTGTSDPTLDTTSSDIVPVCGDGKVEGDETCDPGQNAGGLDCNLQCQPNFCGDGYHGADEECDDGNASNNDACLNDCTLATCGDGFHHQGVEHCDAGPDNGTYNGPCNATCTAGGPYCGDNVWDKDHEACDGPDKPQNTKCADCQLDGCSSNRYADCNNDMADGCEADLQDSKNNCGMCGKVCTIVCVLYSCI